MFWSKIWFFLVTVAAAIALVIAMVMPAPAERMSRGNQQARLQRACAIANILLRDNARVRVDIASAISAPDTGIPAALSQLTSADITDAQHARVKQLLQALKFNSGKNPDFIIALDRFGRVVARTGEQANSYGENMAGYFLIDDALDGYSRDDLWTSRGALYAVSAVPVVTATLPFDWAGAIVTGRLMGGDFANELKNNLSTEVSLYTGGELLASSSSAQIHADVLKAVSGEKKPVAETCGAMFTVEAGGKSHDVITSGLPGEAGALGAYYSLSIPSEAAVGFSGTLDAVTKDDLSFKRFPWVPIGGLFLVVVGAGIGLMWWETDRPLRRLAKDAVNLAKGDGERLNETLHRGKPGSIARSVNVALDKLLRETKTAKSDLDQLLGPLPGQSSSRGGGKEMPPPVQMPIGMGMTSSSPSDFRFSDSNKSMAPAPALSARRATSVNDMQSADTGFGELDLELPPPPPNVVAAAAAQKPMARAMPATHQQVTPKPIAMPKFGGDSIPSLSTSADFDLERSIGAAAGRNSIDDDILGDGPSQGFGRDSEPTVISEQPAMLANRDADATYFRQVFEEFVALKRKCGEPTDTLTFDKFAVKLRNNRDQLQAKHGCKSVKFAVYVKDGRAALKASPVR